MSIKEVSMVNFDSCSNVFHSIDITEKTNVKFNSCNNAFKFIGLSDLSFLTYNNCDNEFHSIDFKGNSISAFNACRNQFHTIDVKDNAELNYTNCNNIFYSIEITDSGKGTFKNNTFMHGYNASTLANIVANDSSKVVIENCTIPADGNIHIYVKNNAEVVLRNCSFPLTAITVSDNSTLFLDNVVFKGNSNSTEYLQKSITLRNNSILILKNTPVVSKIDANKDATIVQHDKSFRKTQYSFIHGDVVTVKKTEQNFSIAEIADIYRKKKIFPIAK